MAKHQPPDVRRQQIFEAGLVTLAEKGYAATRIDDIAVRAGLSKGAIYHHFTSKQELFIDLLEALVDDFTAAFEELATAVVDAGDVRTALRESIARLSGEMSPELRRGLMEFYLLAARDDAFRARFDRHYAALVAGAAALLRQGVERGELRADLDCQRAARVFIVSIDGLFVMHLLLGTPDSGDADVAALVDYLLDGFSGDAP